MSKSIIDLIESGAIDIFDLFAMFHYENEKTLRYIATNPLYITHIKKMAFAILNYRRRKDNDYSTISRTNRRIRTDKRNGLKRHQTKSDGSNVPI